MPYPFTFDLSNLSRPFLEELKRLARKLSRPEVLIKAAKSMVRKFRIDQKLGIKPSEAERVVSDLLHLYSVNERLRDSFHLSKHRVLVLPHCARKYMDNRCKALFDPSIPTYICAGCSEDCLINAACSLAKALGYDVYVVPGGSCLRKLLSRGYDGVVGVACPEEVVRAESLLAELGIAGQAVPLLRNGCANTCFSLDLLKEILAIP